MLIPSEIKKKMHSAAKHFKAGGKLMADVDEWFEQRGFSSEAVRSGDGVSLEEIEYGNDITDLFCAQFEVAQTGDGETAPVPNWDRRFGVKEMTK